TASVNKAGIAKFAFSLADGTKASQSVPLSKNGDAPLYLSLYGGKGFMAGWITFTNAETEDLRGAVSWIKPSLSKTKYYPGGFTLDTVASGSSYQRGQTLSLSTADLVLEGAGLSSAFTNRITISSANRVSNFSSNKLTLSFSTSGTFKGRVTP